jgi:hypothetical protein
MRFLVPRSGGSRTKKYQEWMVDIAAKIFLSWPKKNVEIIKAQGSQ